MIPLSFQRQMREPARHGDASSPAQPRAKKKRGFIRTFTLALGALLVAILAMAAVASLAMTHSAWTFVGQIGRLQSLAIPFAIVRVTAICALWIGWPAICRRLALRNGWSEAYSAEILRFGGRVIPGMLFVDFVLINAPIWSALLGW